MKHYKSAGGVLFDMSLKKVYLIYKISRKEWLLPKGQVEDGQSMVETAKREIGEETGYQDFVILGNIPIETISFKFNDNGRRAKKTIYIFASVLLSDKRKLTREMKVEGLSGKWFSVKESLKKASKGDIKKAIKRAYDKIKDCRSNIR